MKWKKEEKVHLPLPSSLFGFLWSFYLHLLSFPFLPLFFPTWISPFFRASQPASQLCCSALPLVELHTLPTPPQTFSHASRCLYVFHDIHISSCNWASKASIDMTLARKAEEYGELTWNGKPIWKWVPVFLVWRRRRAKLEEEGEANKDKMKKEEVEAKKWEPGR